MHTGAFHPSPVHRLVALCFVAASLLACSNPNFDLEWQLKTPRVLAIVADPPQFPGNGRQGVWLHAAFFDPIERPHQFEWVVCSGSESIGSGTGGFGGGQYTAREPQRACAPGEPGVVELISDGPTAIMSREVAMNLANDVGVQRSSFANLPPAVLAYLAASIGVSVTVQLTVYAENQILVVAYKRVLLTPSYALPSSVPVNTNPVVARVQVTTRGTGSVGGIAFPVSYDCSTEQPARIGRFSVGESRYLLVDAIPSRDKYLAVDPSGAGLLMLSERNYFSWFTSRGTLSGDEGSTVSGRSIYFAEPGLAQVFVVVRDGHGGGAFCRLEFEVVDLSGVGP